MKIQVNLFTVERTVPFGLVGKKLNNFFSGKFIYADRAIYRRRTPHLLAVVINSYILLTSIKQAASFNLLFRSLEELNSSGTMIVQTPMLIIRAETPPH